MQWDKELAGTRQISRWHGKGTAGPRLTMGCRERKSLSAGGFFFFADFSIFFLTALTPVFSLPIFKVRKQ